MSKSTTDGPMACLSDLSQNLWWSWDPRAVSLFAEIDARIWQRIEHNPVALLANLSAKRNKQLAADTDFCRRVRATHRRFKQYLRARTWYQQHTKSKPRGLVGYFCMEFGLHESLPIYSGGLGILAGDHFKSASDLGLPLVGIGILWRQGYFRQGIDKAGNQTHRYDRLNPADLPISEVTKPNGTALELKLQIGQDKVVARAWRLAVGRMTILLLDTDLPANPPQYRKLTNRLYSGDRQTRIRQEVLLGVGGWKLLRELKLPVSVCHLNEGHAAFCSLERVAELMKDRDLSFTVASKRVAASTVFTTHTPVPAGNETFDPKLVLAHMKSHARQLGLTNDALLALGRIDPSDTGEDFGMTPLALRLAKKANGVSELHTEVSRKMWQAVWPKRALDRVPIGAITNGVHIRTWLHPTMSDFFDEWLPSDWDAKQDRESVWAKVKNIPAKALWELHCKLKLELIDFVRAQPSSGSRALDPNALTIGFARRFAPYKRAALIFSDIERLNRIINNTRRPVQLIFAGKAHPADADGQELVTQIVRQTRSRRFKTRVIFLEDYTIDIARHMVSGVDVWLNNPRRPHEASGTSGMKPALHGGLNLSILDGWWPEACKHGKNGWFIGTNKDHSGSAAADARDARSLYRCLEREIVPLYFERNRQGVPIGWLRCMKNAIATIAPTFNSHRMVKQYLGRYYLPCLRSESKK